MRLAALLYISMLILLAGCAGGGINLNEDQKVLACQFALNLAVKPECDRLDEINPAYVGLCKSSIALAAVACNLADRDDGEITAKEVCAPIASLRPQCATVVPGDDPRNVALCQRVLLLAEGVCAIKVAGDDSADE